MPAPIDLKQAFEQQPHTFLQPSPDLYNGFLQLAKSYLDPLASNTVESQTERLRSARQSRKRKRKSDDLDDVERARDILRVKRVHIDGLDMRQIWQQAKRVLASSVEEAETRLDHLVGESELDSQEKNEIDASDRRKVRFAGDEQSDQDEDDESLGEEGVDWEYEGDDTGELDDESDGGVQLNGASQTGAELSDGEESLDLGQETPPSEVSDEHKGEILVKDKYGLNDGFFSIDQFNKHTQFLEQVDARGDSDDGRASDEDDVDWTIDPLLADPQPDISKSQRNQQSARKATSNVTTNDLDEDEEDEEDDGGPTFGNMDLNAPEGDSDQDDELDSEDVDVDDFLTNTNNITYKDFFAPPAQTSKPKKQRPRPNLSKGPENLSTELNDAGTADRDLERTISSVHRDLFEDELSDNPDDTNTPADKSKANSNLSTHEKRQLALRAEIRRLEAENVATKHWSMAGESLAPSRPVNSLLEEDLDFERTGKPVPVVTEEVSEDIEALIKRRILALDFNEVTRRRPAELPGDQPRRRGALDAPELSTSKHERSLADEYADDHLRATDPAYVDKRSEALRKAHADIAAHWAAVSAQLDALCNWRYKPKPAAPSMEIRVDAPAISIEDARPTGAEADMGDGTMLAPQEVWSRRGEGAGDGQVVTKGGSVVAREEMSREQKKRRRNREKERMRKAAANEAPASSKGDGGNGPKGGNKNKNKNKEKADVVGQLTKGGAKIIDSKGTVRGMDGETVDEKNRVGNGAGQFKL